jgi:hypothetical protein
MRACGLICREIARELEVNLLGYDYSGYGASSGQPSVLNALADIEACYEWLRSVRSVAPQDIIAYGQSVRMSPLHFLPGTGQSCMQCQG